MYDNVTILQEQINNLTERLNRIESLQVVGDRFTDMGNGTILDNDSGLIWLKNANCVNLPHTDEYGMANWDDAKVAVGDLEWGICGLEDESRSGDWRLPTPAEWEAFYSTSHSIPALVNTVGDAQWSEGDAFTGVQSAIYWSTEYEHGYAWISLMSSGRMGRLPESDIFYVWPVRNDH